MKTGTEVLKIKTGKYAGKYAVQLFYGDDTEKYGIFSKRRHAEEYIFQQNCVFVFGDREDETR